jgi:hypothetical protein
MWIAKSKTPNQTGDAHMNFISEYSLLVAIALPVLAVVGLNLFLAFTGERHTLLLPIPMSFEAVGGEVMVIREEGARQIDTTRDPANEELARLAA